MRGSTLFAAAASAGLMFFGAFLGLHPRLERLDAVQAHGRRAAMVRGLDVTDLCIFTEARYTRHPAVTGRHAPFQDHPTALERFPSGAVMPPPQHLFHNEHDVD